MKYIKPYNESIKDYLKPKPIDQIKKSLQTLTPNEKFEKGIDNDSIDIIRQSLEEGADIHITEPNYLNYILSINCRYSDDFEIAKLLIKYGADLQKSIKYGELFGYYYKTSLINKLKKINESVRDYQVVESIKDYLKPKSEDQILKDMGKIKPKKLLEDSIEQNYTKGILLSIQKGAIPNFDMIGQLCKDKKYDIIKLILDSVSNKKGISNNLLIQSVYNNDIICVKMALENGADKNVKIGEMNNVLFISLTNNYLDIFKYLIENGATITQEVITETVCRGNIELFKYIIDNGADMSGLDFLVVNNAIYYKQYEMVKFLLENGYIPKFAMHQIINNVNKISYSDQGEKNKYLDLLNKYITKYNY